MLIKNTLKNPVSLRWLKSGNFIETLDYNFILKEDIWQNGLLLLRSGRYLTEDVLDKLLNFGIDEVNIYLNQDEYDEDEFEAIEELKKNFIRTQNILIIDREFKNISYLAKILMETGFCGKNIFASTDLKLIKRYFQDKKPAYLFIDSGFGINHCYKIINTLENIENVHINFISSKAEDKAEVIKDFETGFLDIRVLFKPVTANHLKHIISQCIDQDFCRLLKNEKNTNIYEIKIGA